MAVSFCVASFGAGQPHGLRFGRSPERSLGTVEVASVAPSNGGHAGAGAGAGAGGAGATDMAYAGPRHGIARGDIVVGVNGRYVAFLPSRRVMECVRTATRPLSIVFARMWMPSPGVPRPFVLKRGLLHKQVCVMLCLCLCLSTCLLTCSGVCVMAGREHLQDLVQTLLSDQHLLAGLLPRGQ